MNVNIPFIWVPILAVACYLFLMIALLSAKKNNIIQSFIRLLACCLLWTGGSMLMRLQVYPGYEFWYEVSILALFAIPLMAYQFVYHLVDSSDKYAKKLWMLGTVVMLVLTHFQLFLKVPELVHLPNGNAIFVYHTTWTIGIPTVFLVLMMIHGIGMVSYGVKERDVPLNSLMPVMIGLPIMVVGNLVSIIPGNYFPWDTLSGIVNACLMFYALYRKRLFRMTLLVSRGVVMAEAMLLCSVMGAYLINPMESVLLRYYPQVEHYSILIIAILFAVFMMSVYQIMQMIFNNLFLKEEQVQNDLLKEFTMAVSNSLEIKEVLALLVDVICSAIHVKKAYVCLLDDTKRHYKPVQSAAPLDIRGFSISADNPCITWFKDRDHALMVKEFKRSATYKSMWEEEKRLIYELRASCILPLKSDGVLAGVVLLGEKQRGSDFTFDDISFLESVQSIASVAVKNASLYERAKREATTDQLTGLLNRKSFMQALQEEYDAKRQDSLALLILNVDDFKLFNQLYGTYEGDKALQRIAQIIDSTVGSNGTSCRYGGKEFAVSLPGYNALQTMNLAENIRSQIGKIDKNSDGARLKKLTVCGGICVAPYCASTVKELLENTDMAVYNAKRSGKNKICQYTMGERSGDDINTASNILESNYEEYAATIYALTAAIDAKDHYTFQHSQNVADYASALAKAAGLNDEHVRIIHEAALLHDIGKIAVPEHILRKPGRLDEEEYDIMKSHVEHSIAIIRHLPSLDYVIPAVVGHHERWDGRGYPRGIAGEDLPIGARCLAIADAFDAMTSARSYKKAYTVEFACEELISQSGRQFDPMLVPVFLELIKNGTVKVNDTEQK
ncbi:diguanylate cyclase [Clostridium sp. MCC353]|uniref:histidine kinase N-terminal 7TM domain-containing diguanylate cyclase/phosphohydrolase n=1 Tax=Clostridium sp. MCC353 TaxID=2592646 RepID=UPI001C00A31D|nr:HD domain-containing phosphohydrolase [Clostridium sp. MCC353]MBT9777885.1 diguanylate cyclase [Clostridium sp. MCC353]